MAPINTVLKQKPTKSVRRAQKAQQKLAESKEISILQTRIKTEAPPKGQNPLLKEDKATRDIEPHIAPIETKSDYKLKQHMLKTHATSALVASLKKFSDMPISETTQSGLNDNNFTHLTKIQRASINHALAGRDILAEARTGSGKTLAYVIPVLENLYRLQWNPKEDGLGAVIICPTRELAIQVFDVLRKVGKYHKFSAALIVGGKDFKDEQKMLSGINILVSTPGRLMHHMDTCYDFDTSNVRLVVFDEADHILDLGFEKQLLAILDNLPPHPQRQTLLFSATLSSAVTRLASLGLHEPEVINVHLNETSATPEQLHQRYMVVPGHKKVEALYTFIKIHIKAKTIIFLNTCNEVQYLFDAFCHFSPGLPLRRIHGKMSQSTRMEIYYDFCNRDRAVLLCTDICARGLDFPNIDWVVQGDCPQTTEQYIHRVGRTARFQAKGKSLLLLLPSELKFVERLEEAKVNIKPVEQELKSKRDMTSLMAGAVAEKPDLKFLAQKAFISYIRSIHLAEDKEVFDLSKVDGIGYCLSLGLPSVPVIKNLKGSQSFLKAMSYEEKRAYLDKERRRKLEKKRAKQAKALGVDISEVVLDEDIEEEKKKKLEMRKKTMGKKGHLDEVDMLFVRQNQGVLHERRLKMTDNSMEDDDDDFMTITRRDHDVDTSDMVGVEEEEDNDSTKFSSLLSNLDELNDDGDFIENMKERVRLADIADKQREKTRVQEKRKLKKQLARDDDDDEGACVLDYNSDFEDELEDGFEEEVESEEEVEPEVVQPKMKRRRTKTNKDEKKVQLPVSKNIEINLNESSDDEE